LGFGVSVIVALFNTVEPPAMNVAFKIAVEPDAPNMLSSRNVMLNGKVKRCGVGGSDGSSGIIGPLKAICTSPGKGDGTFGTKGGFANCGPIGCDVSMPISAGVKPSTTT
jgi:hypothetical protein